MTTELTGITLCLPFGETLVHILHFNAECAIAYAARKYRIRLILFIFLMIWGMYPLPKKQENDRVFLEKTILESILQIFFFQPNIYEFFVDKVPSDWI